MVHRRLGVRYDVGSTEGSEMTRRGVGSEMTWVPQRGPKRRGFRRGVRNDVGSAEGSETKWVPPRDPKRRGVH